MSKPDEKQKTPTTDYEEVPDVYAEPWKDPDVGDSIEGRFVGVNKVKGDRDEYFDSFVLQQLDESLISVAGGSLEKRMNRIPEGTKLRITFMGTQKHKGNNMKLFKVDMAKGTKLLPISFKSNKSTNNQTQSDDIPF